MPAPATATMQDEAEAAPLCKHVVEETEFDGFAELLGAGKGGDGPIEIINPTEKDTWPVVGKQDQQFCRYKCLCYEYGWMGDVMENPQCQVYCLHCTLNPFKFELITALPLQEDLNFCQVKYVCCETGCFKFKLAGQCLCIKCDFGGGDAVAPS